MTGLAGKQSSDPSARVCAWVVTPAPGSTSIRAGAIGCIDLHGPSEELDRVLDQLVKRATRQPGTAWVGWLHGDTGQVIDQCVFVRWSGQHASIMPHDGGLVVRLILKRLGEVGVEVVSGQNVGLRERWPEASSLVEARMLGALARNPSPLATDLLLAQPELWKRAGDADGLLIDEQHAARAKAMARLLQPPLVVVVGPPNVGKSSLTNALAGQGVSLSFDLPGTTRDVVGVHLNLAGLTVRWLDTPGLSQSPMDALDAESQAMARQIAAKADVLVVCADAGSIASLGGMTLFESLGLPSACASKPTVWAALREDLGVMGEGSGFVPSVRVRLGGDLREAGLRHEGLTELVKQICWLMVPQQGIEENQPWAFWL